MKTKLLLLQAVVNLAYELEIDSLALISSSSMTVETFLAEATALGIRVPNILELNRDLLKEHGQKQVNRKSYKYYLFIDEFSDSTLF